MTSRIELTFRRARKTESRLLWEWRNEASTLRQSFNATPIDWGTHQKWFRSKQQDPKCHLLILESRKKPVGHVRVDVGGRGAGEMHINLDKKARGKGLGSAGIAAVASHFLEKGLVRKLRAHVKPDNHASIRAFLNAGFQLKDRVTIKGADCCQLTRP